MGQSTHMETIYNKDYIEKYNDWEKHAASRETVYDSLFAQDLVQTKLELSAIQTEEIYGGVICWLEKGTIYEQNAFLQALQEIVDPIESPRY